MCVCAPAVWAYNTCIMMRGRAARYASKPDCDISAFRHTVADSSGSSLLC